MDLLKRTIRLAVAALLAAPLAGCLQVETLIHLNPDGSAEVSERVQFSRRLLDFGEDAGAGQAIAALLEKPAALARMKQMGPGVALVSHQVRDGAEGAREAVIVYHLADLNDFRYVSPFVGFGDYADRSVLAVKMFPIYESTWYGRRAGEMAVQFSAVSRSGSKPKDNETPPPPPAPRELQILRELQPIFRDMLRGVHLRLTFESYASIRMRQYYRYRGMRSGTHQFDLLDFSDQTLDQYGFGFMDNEEVMLELLRGELASPNIVNNVKEHGTNATLPVYHVRNVPEIYFRPSRPLFEKLFTGKTLTFDKRESEPRPARFEQDGWRGDTKEPADKG